MSNDHIVVTDGSGVRHACIAGTGIEVFEVVKVYRAVDEDFARLRGAFDWLTVAQLQAALAYAQSHSKKIARRLAAEERAPERLMELWEKFPTTAPQRQ